MTVSERLAESKKELEAVITALNQTVEQEGKLRTRAVELQGVIKAFTAMEAEPEV